MEGLVFGVQVGAVIVYTYVYSMLAPPVRAKEIHASSSTDLAAIPEAETAHGPDLTDPAHPDSEGVALLIPEAPPATPQVRH